MAARQMCWRSRLTNVVYDMIGVPYEALTGEYGLAWQLVSWCITVPVLLTGLWAWLVLLGRTIGRGLAGPLPDPASTASPREILAHSGNHGAAENELEALDGSEAEPDEPTTLATWIPHPDDPLPAEASGIPEEDEEPSPDLAPVAPQLVSTGAQASQRRSRRRRRL